MWVRSLSSLLLSRFIIIFSSSAPTML
jgi:hypothetical protein